MNDQDKLRYFAQICLAAAEGKQIQTRDALQGWRDIRMEDVRQYAPDSFGGNALRIKPETTPEYWSRPEHVPGPVCWIRRENCTWDRMIIMVNHSRLTAVGGYSEKLESLTWQDLADQKFSYSTDRINWQTCTVKEAR